MFPICSHFSPDVPIVSMVSTRIPTRTYPVPTCNEALKRVKAVFIPWALRIPQEGGCSNWKKSCEYEISLWKKTDVVTEPSLSLYFVSSNQHVSWIGDTEKKKISEVRRTMRLRHPFRYKYLVNQGLKIASWSSYHLGNHHLTNLQEFSLDDSECPDVISVFFGASLAIHSLPSLHSGSFSTTMKSMQPKA